MRAGSWSRLKRVQRILGDGLSEIDFIASDPALMLIDLIGADFLQKAVMARTFTAAALTCLRELQALAEDEQKTPAPAKIDVAIPITWRDGPEDES